MHAGFGLASGVTSLFLAALVAASAGCSDRKLDLRTLETVLADRFSAEAGVPVSAVTCPKVVRTRKGDIFECTVRFAGGETLVVAVEQMGGTRTRPQPKERVLYAKDLEPRLQAELDTRRIAAQARCPARIYTLPRTPISAQAPAQAAAIVCTAEGEVGRFRIEATYAGEAERIDITPEGPTGSSAAGDGSAGNTPAVNSPEPALD